MSASKPVKWTPDEDEFLRTHYFSHERKEIAAMLGRTMGSIRKRCSTLGLNQKHPKMTEDEIEAIRSWYTERQDATRDDFNLKSLSAQLGRTPQFISRYAAQMGLTNQARSRSEEHKIATSKRSRQYIKENGHPKGATGMKHSDAMRQEMSIRVKRHWAEMTPLEMAIQTSKMTQTRIQRYGSGNASMNGINAYSRTKSGKRADLNNQFFRSAWEANYARYLNWQIEQGLILSWQFEPHTFVFHGVVRGQLTYTPDFKVINTDGSHEWHEVKGWMDAKSKAKLKRMAKFYPNEKVILIDADEYKAISKWKGLIDGWE